MRRSRFLVPLIAGLLLLPGSLRAAEPPIGITELVSRLDRAAADARRGIDSPSSQAMQDLRTRIGLPLAIAVKPPIELPADEVLDSLKGDKAADFQAALARIGVLREAAAAAQQHAASPPRSFDDVLQRAYRGIEEESSFSRRMREAIGSFLLNVLTALVQGLTDPSGLITAVGWAIFVILLALLLFWVFRLRLVSSRALPTTSAEVPQDVDWHDVARRALARGDSIEAVRAYFRSLIKALARRGVLDDKPSLTAGECRLAVNRKAPALYEAVVGATSVFERVTYGLAPLTQSDLNTMISAEEWVRAA